MKPTLTHVNIRRALNSFSAFEHAEQSFLQFKTDTLADGSASGWPQQASRQRFVLGRFPPPRILSGRTRPWFCSCHKSEVDSDQHRVAFRRRRDKSLIQRESRHWSTFLCCYLFTSGNTFPFMRTTQWLHISTPLRETLLAGFMSRKTGILRTRSRAEFHVCSESPHSR